MKWITRERVKVDRVACPWLIKKFVDPAAEFVFLPHDTDWSSVHDGTVYDVPDCELGHHGEEVSFEAILKKFGLTDPALALLAQIVRARLQCAWPKRPRYLGAGDHRLRCAICRVQEASCKLNRIVVFVLAARVPPIIASG